MWGKFLEVDCLLHRSDQVVLAVRDPFISVFACIAAGIGAILQGTHSDLKSRGSYGVGVVFTKQSAGTCEMRARMGAPSAKKEMRTTRGWNIYRWFVN